MERYSRKGYSVLPTSLNCRTSREAPRKMRLSRSGHRFNRKDWPPSATGSDASLRSVRARLLSSSLRYVPVRTRDRLFLCFREAPILPKQPGQVTRRSGSAGDRTHGAILLRSPARPSYLKDSGNPRMGFHVHSCYSGILELSFSSPEEFNCWPIVASFFTMAIRSIAFHHSFIDSAILFQAFSSTSRNGSAGSASLSKRPCPPRERSLYAIYTPSPLPPPSLSLSLSLVRSCVACACARAGSLVHARRCT